MHFYLENDLPVLTGRFLSPDGGETRENERDASSTPIPWQLTWVQWFELQNTLAEAALPAYEKPPQDAAEEAYGTSQLEAGLPGPAPKGG